MGRLGNRIACSFDDPLEPAGAGRGAHCGDRIVIYTDGLVDEPAPGGIDRATAELKATLAGHVHQPAAELADRPFNESNDADCSMRHDDALLRVIAIK